MLWGERDHDDLVNRTRDEAFEDLLEGLSYFEQQIAEPEALERLKKARTLALEAREFYRAGNYRGGVLTIQEAYEQFMEVKVRGRTR